MLHVVLVVLGTDAELGETVAGVLAAVDGDHGVVGAVLDDCGECGEGSFVIGGLFGGFVGEPGGECGETGEAGGVAEGESVGDAAALAEAEDDGAVWVGVVLLLRFGDEIGDVANDALELLGGALEVVGGVEPGVGGHAGLDLEFGFGADHEQPPIGEVGGEAEQVLAVRAVTVDGDDGGEEVVGGGLSGKAGMPDRVCELHPGTIVRSALEGRFAARGRGLARGFHPCWWVRVVVGRVVTD